ncbi:hypothetical protein V1278_004163 [Bradyrhizobium sp. AZCC 1577]
MAREPARSLPGLSGLLYFGRAEYPMPPGASWLDVFRVTPFKNRRFSPFVTLRRRDDFGMVPPDLRPPFWAGKASFLCVRRYPR